MGELRTSPGGPNIRAYRPARATGYLAKGTDPAADALLARLQTTGTVRRRRLTRSWRGAIGVAAVVLGGTTAAAAYIALREPTDRTTITCWSDPDIETNKQIGLTATSELTPTQQCSPLWTDGTLGSGSVPPLTECINDGGAVAVVPNLDGGCGSIGLSDHAASGDAPPDRSGDLTAAISERFAGQCFDADDAEREVRATLDGLGLSSWTIVPAPGAGDACVVAAIEPAVRTVRLVALP